MQGRKNNFIQIKKGTEMKNKKISYDQTEKMECRIAGIVTHKECFECWVNKLDRKIKYQYLTRAHCVSKNIKKEES